MSFIWPGMLAILAVIPPLVALYRAAGRRRQRIAARYGDLGLMSGAAPQPDRRRHIPAMIFFTGLTILLVGLARPEAALNLPRREGTVILVFDVSRSMGADDVQPTRMEVAKTTAQEFVERQPSAVRIGVVAFSDSGLAVQVPTSKRENILAAIDRLQPQLGTSLGQGILSALNTIAIDSVPAPDPASSPAPDAPAEALETPAVIVLFSDGDNNAEPDPLEAAQLAFERSVQIYTIGVGSPAGATLNIDGFHMHTRLDEALLQQIAQLSEGAYYSAASQHDLQAIYDSVETRLVVRPEKMEVTALFAGAGILILLIGGVCSLLWFNRMP